MILTTMHKAGIAGIFLVVIVVIIYVATKKDTTAPAPVTVKPAVSGAGAAGAGAAGAGAAGAGAAGAAKMEVYYADKGGTNESRYVFTTKEQAEAHAKSLGGTLATIDQIRDAHSKGLNVCWFGFASDNLKYTISQASHGPGSGCDGNSVGVSSYPAPKAGAWVYGVKPASNSVNCMSPGVTSPCILPFNTVTKKWSQYS